MKFVLAAFVLATCFACVLSGAIVATPLKRAFDAAIIEFINSGERADFQSQHPLGTPSYGNYADCIPEADEYPYPALQRRGSYARILRGIESLRIGTVGTINGFVTDITAGLINIINSQFGAHIEPVFYVYPTEDEMLAGLEWRQIDMTAPVFDLGLFFSNNTYPISYWFPKSCSVFAAAPVFVVVDNSSYTDAASLNGARICTYFNTWSWFVQPVVPASNIAIDLNCDSGLGTIYDAIYLIEFSVQSDFQTRTIDSGTIVPAVAFFQNRGPPIDPEPALPEPVGFDITPQPSTSNTPVASSTPSPSLTGSPSLSQSSGASASPSVTSSATLSESSAPSPSLTSSISVSESNSISLSASTSVSGQPTATPTSSVTPSVTGSNSISLSGSSSLTPTTSQTPSTSLSLSETASPTLSDSITPSVSLSNTASPTLSLSNTASPSLTPTITPSNSVAPTSPIVLPSSTNPLGNNG